MTFSSLTFVTLFFPAVLILYFIINNLRWKNGVLLVASLLFYSWGEPVWVLGMIGATAINYFAALFVGEKYSGFIRKTALIIGSVASLSVLFYFKYAAFLFNSFASLFGASINIPVLQLPVGISFYTFQVLTYTVDVYRGKSPVQRNPFKLMLYVSCFPQLIAGPIVQYSDVALMLDNRSTELSDFISGMKRFVIGLSKKILLANVCGLIIEELPAAAGGAVSVLGAWYISVLYSLQLYFDFSGYSDMAIGMGKIFGFEYKENFNYPYISKSATEFWRRWHISLGSFFRDYVYIPLGGNRCSTGRVIFNLAVVWALTGLWHGASWNFVIWGVYYGVLLIIEKFVLSDVLKRTPGLIRRIVTLFLIVIGWTVFYYTDMPQMIKHLGAMFSIGASGLTDPVTMAVLRKYTVFPIVAMIASTPVLPKVCGAFTSLCRNKTVNEVLSLAYLSVLLYLSMIFMVGQSYNPFIYFRF